jgi:hypothetical protein
MRLPDGPRQVIAALVAGGVFVALYFAGRIVWWAAFGLAAGVYLALLLVIGRRRPGDEIMLASHVSAADLERASTGLDQAAGRLASAAGRAPDIDQALIRDMAARVRSIRAKVAADPEDFRRTRRFILSYLPNMVETVERYAALARQAGEAHADRLAALRERIRAYGPALDRIDQACLENDFDALEVEVEVLATQMKRG